MATDRRWPMSESQRNVLFNLFGEPSGQRLLELIRMIDGDNSEINADFLDGNSSEDFAKDFDKIGGGEF